MQGEAVANLCFARPTGRISADFVFREERVAVFVDGCFWHACPKHSNVPASNRAFWKRKLARNQFRDRQVNRMLRKIGWRVIRIWEHDLAKRGEGCARRIMEALSLRCSRNSTQRREGAKTQGRKRKWLLDQ